MGGDQDAPHRGPADARPRGRAAEPGRPHSSLVARKVGRHGLPRRADGRPDPRGLAIVCCCDAFNAMTTDRSYRDAMSPDEAIEELQVNSGTQFSPAVVEALLRVLQEDPLTAEARGPRAVTAV